MIVFFSPKCRNSGIDLFILAYFYRNFKNQNDNTQSDICAIFIYKHINKFKSMCCLYIFTKLLSNCYKSNVFIMRRRDYFGYIFSGQIRYANKNSGAVFPREYDTAVVLISLKLSQCNCLFFSILSGGFIVFCLLLREMPRILPRLKG